MSKLLKIQTSDCRSSEFAKCKLPHAHGRALAAPALVSDSWQARRYLSQGIAEKRAQKAHKSCKLPSDSPALVEAERLHFPGLEIRTLKIAMLLNFASSVACRLRGPRNVEPLQLLAWLP